MTANCGWLHMMQHHREGLALQELSAALQRVVAAVAQTGKGGALTFKLTVQPAKRGSGGAVLIEDEIREKIPAADTGVSIFFADAETGALSRDNPNQLNLELKTVPGEVKAEEIKKAVSQ